ncbi:MAG: succinate-semialdehyde dehydrogenase [Nitrospirae bacterium GWD2_57_9]|nr:MAG: succinate-semialdehyde dehydrogenase [Nitrospirae bacterium GWD2_57_9]OGW50591.1 MAG: succinate-semialdehyde dehydrogenase [Nitrospirae bacterium GWC2_57_9]
MKVSSLKSFIEKRKSIQSINPYTEEVMKEIPLMTRDDIAAQAERSREAFKSWSSRPLSERTGLVKKLGDHLRADKRKYAELITKEMGKPIKESLAEIEKCAWLCDYYAENAGNFLKPEEIRTENKKSMVLFQPLGVALAIMPWNFPYWQAFRFGIPAVTAGNVILLKHASNVPQTALSIEDAFRAAGFPEDVFKTLIIDVKEALNLIDTDQVDAVSLTGSNAAGEQVGAHAGAKIKKLVLELGGSDPFIVLDDADVEKAGRTAANARMINAGQSCIAAKRFIVMDKAAEEFRTHFIARLKELKVGDPMDESTDVGPLARRDLLEALNRQLQDAKKSGAEIVQIGNGAGSKKGFFFSPVAVFNPRLDSKVMKEEVFGPIAPVVVVKSEDEAVRIANDTEFGLGASIWSRNIDRAEKLAARVESGFVAINDSVKSDPRLPFGGVKKSGIGRELSEYGLKEFVNIKTVVVKE